jgi:hypothetical protein
MFFRFLADLVVLCHLVFVLFAAAGSLLAFRWPVAAWMHVPAAVWGALVEFGGWICPLTPLENWLRLQGNKTAYSGGFIDHYIMPILYPSGLTREIQIILGLAILVVNASIYGYIILRHRLIRQKTTPDLRRKG